MEKGFIEQLKQHSKAWEEFERWYLWEYRNLSNISKYQEHFWKEEFCDLRFEMQSGVFIAFLVDREILNIHYNVPISKDALQMFLLKSFEILNNKGNNYEQN